MPSKLATTTLEPAPIGKAQVKTVAAIPFSSVVEVDGETVPVPISTTKVTNTPGTRLPSTSVTAALSSVGTPSVQSSGDT
jgi:hypothetical protein